MKSLLSALLLFLVSGNSSLAAVSLWFNNDFTIVSPDVNVSLDGIAPGQDLTFYSRNGIYFKIPDSQCCFADAIYPDSGVHAPFSISSVAGNTFVGIELALKTGWGNDMTQVFYWQTLRDGIVLYSGANILNNLVNDAGATTPALSTVIVSFLDPEGFDELRIAAFPPEHGVDINGDNALAIQSAMVEFQTTAVPGPEAGAGLAGLLLAGAGGYVVRRRRQASV